jgi:hypothetical protein
MGDVIRLPLKRKETIRGAIRAALSRGLNSVDKPEAAVIVVLNGDGMFSINCVNHGALEDFDVFSRAEAVLHRKRMNFIRD